MAVSKTRRMWLVVAVAGLFLVTALAYAQTGSLTVTAMAGTPSPQPACVGQEVTASLTATVSSPPASPVSPPTWTWEIVEINYKATAGGGWTQVDPEDTSYGFAGITHTDTSSPDATLWAVGAKGGYYKIKAKATVEYDSPAVQASGTVEVEMMAVQLTLTPPSLLMQAGTTDSVTTSVLPSDFTGTIAITVGSSIISVTGSPPLLTVTASSSVTDWAVTTIDAHLGSASGPTCGTCVVTVTNNTIPNCPACQSCSLE